MATSASLAPVLLEDPLAHLPRSAVLEYPKGRVIYDRDQPSTNIYLVIDGKVKVSRFTSAGREVVVDIYRADDLFGESAFLHMEDTSEQAKAFEKARLMAWPVHEIEALTTKQPRLAVALLQVFVQRNFELAQRIESFSMEDISRRVARTFLRLSERLGTPERDGSIRMLPLTHELLSQYVGTSREVITLHMNRFRRQGYLRYSRKGMAVYHAALRDWLASHSYAAS